MDAGALVDDCCGSAFCLDGEVRLANLTAATNGRKTQSEKRIGESPDKRMERELTSIGAKVASVMATSCLVGSGARPFSAIVALGSCANAQNDQWKDRSSWKVQFQVGFL